MKRLLITLAACAALAAPLAAAEEKPVAPYAMSNENAGTGPFTGDEMYKEFHEQAGIDRMVDDFVTIMMADPRITDIFKAHDIERLRRTFKEQFGYILHGDAMTYSGRDMKESHKDLGLQNADFNAAVEDLQKAMDNEKISFRAQNKFLAKLAPMQRDVVTR